MTDATALRVAAALFGLSGLVNIVADGLPGTAWWNLAGVAAGLLGLPAVYIAAGRGTGVATLIAALLAGLGLIGIAGFLFVDAAILPQLAPEISADLLAGQAGLVIFAAVLLYVLGVLSFAAALWRSGALPRPALALWAMGTLPTVAAIALPPVVMTVAETIAGAGVVWIALSLHRLSTAETSLA